MALFRMSHIFCCICACKPSSTPDQTETMWRRLGCGVKSREEEEGKKSFIFSTMEFEIVPR